MKQAPFNGGETDPKKTLASGKTAAITVPASKTSCTTPRAPGIRRKIVNDEVRDLIRLLLRRELDLLVGDSASLEDAEDAAALLPGETAFEQVACGRLSWRNRSQAKAQNHSALMRPLQDDSPSALRRLR